MVPTHMYDGFFDIGRHRRYLMKHLRCLHSAYIQFDSNKSVALFFILSSLDILCEENELILESKEREDLINWVYSLQIIPTDEYKEVGGFRGGLSIGNYFSPIKGSIPLGEFDCSHIASTLVCILILFILGDDLSRLNSKSALEGLKHLQLSDGSFKSAKYDGECDMRFCYCACAVAYILNGWNYIDTQKLLSHIISCQNYDGGFGQLKYAESHGGSTYCAIASLYLLKLDGVIGSGEQLEKLDTIFERCSYWCCKRQTKGGGFHGRPYKEADTCYSFWIFSCLVLLGNEYFVSEKPHIGFLETTSNALYGGFSKYPGDTPDILHTFFGICGLSLLKINNLRKINIPTMTSEKSSTSKNKRNAEKC